jgi:predicted nuclease of predicted toxin-antitoxin system
MPRGAPTIARLLSRAHKNRCGYELSPRWVTHLKAAGFDAMHCIEVGATARDEEIMTWAIWTDAVVLTHNLDFSAILAFSKNTKPSVVQIRAEDLNSDKIDAPVVSAINQTQSELTAGAIVSVDPVHARL